MRYSVIVRQTQGKKRKSRNDESSPRIDTHGAGEICPRSDISQQIYTEEIMSTEITNNFDTSATVDCAMRESEVAIFEIHHVTSSALSGKEKHVELFCFRPRENKQKSSFIITHSKMGKYEDKNIIIFVQIPRVNCMKNRKITDILFRTIQRIKYNEFSIFYYSFQQIVTEL